MTEEWEPEPAHCSLPAHPMPGQRVCLVYPHKVPITHYLRQICEARQSLTIAEATSLMQAVLAGEASDLELATLFGALSARGETADEIAGFALALRSAAVSLPLTEAEREELVDTCGTGGDGANTFNISTAAALVAAAAGIKVAKHGNRAVTSRCGSADVLEALGIPVDLAPAAAAEALRTHHFCFLLAPAHHPGLRAVMPVRRALGIRTVFNLLGPLLNPAGARRQVMGVYAAHLAHPVAQAMTHLDVRHALVVHGAGGLDELSIAGRSQAVQVRSSVLESFELTPEQCGLHQASLGQLAGGDAMQNAAILRRIFAGEPGPARDVTLLNAGAVLLVAGRAPDLRAGVSSAADILDSGAVLDLLEKLRAP